MIKSIINSELSIPHRKFHNDTLSVQKFRDTKYCQFALSGFSYGLKQEILNSEVDNWFVEQKNESSAQNFDFEIKRKNDKMLKEFGW